MTKIRRVLSDPRKDDMCLMDIVDKITKDMAKDAAMLEIANQKAAYKRLYKESNILERMVKEFKRRMREEIRPEILATYKR